MSSNLKRMMHLETRDQKRENARDRSKRYTQIADDLLRDGMEEIVFARLEGDEPAKLAMDCESVDFDTMPSWEIAIITGMEQDYVEHIQRERQSERAVDALRERLTLAALDIVEDTGSYVGIEYDADDFIDYPPYPSDDEIEQARAEMREEEEALMAWVDHEGVDDDVDESFTGLYGSEVWPPACTMHDIEESHLFRDRGFIITNTPWGAKR